jgi:hypothetical protein
MSTLQRIWRATRDNLIQLGNASRPPVPGASRKPSATDKKRSLLEHLDRNGPKEMSVEGYARAQDLLKAAQARPGGWAKRQRKSERAKRKLAKHR